MNACNEGSECRVAVPAGSMSLIVSDGDTESGARMIVGLVMYSVGASDGEARAVSWRYGRSLSTQRAVGRGWTRSAWICS
jgi:hypothetical protein